MIYRFITRLLLAILIASPAVAQTGPLPAVIVPQGAPTFQETFQTLDVSPDAKPGHRWRSDKGTLGTATWDTSALKIGGYGLAITATRTKTGWTSGAINTRFSFSQSHGYFELQANLPTCIKGAWPGFWMLPITGTGWPKNGEIDAPETVGDGRIYWSTHSGSEKTVTQATAGNCTRAVHRYGVLWRADQIGFYYDRKLVASYPTPADYTVPMYLIVNLATEGGWAGKIDPSISRVQMFVSNVTAWEAQ